MTNSIPAPPANLAPGFYFQQLQSQRASDAYCDKVLTALEAVCERYNVQSVTVKEAILRLFTLSAPMTAKDAETELLLQLLDHFRVELKNYD